MHHTFRRTWIAALLASPLWALAQTPPPANALPTGGQVTAGQAQIQQNGAAMTIQQGSARAAIDWQGFNVGSQARVDFVQPSAQSVTLNRVQGPDASQIFGRITANGQVFLSNPNGVYFAPGASVDVGGLVATTHRISIDDFMAGRTRFERQGATGSVVNEGELRAALGGYIALLAPEVRNQGVIVANLGTVALAAGEAFELQFDGNRTLAGLRVEASTIKSLVDNRSAVLAPGGLVILSAQALDRVQGGVIRNSGRIEATGLAQRGGRIVLEASTQIANSGSISANATAQGPAGSVRLQAPEVVNSGSITATGSDAHPRGGQIEIVAGNVTQTATGVVDASAPVHGGSVQIRASGHVELAGRVAAQATLDLPAPRPVPAAAPTATTAPVPAPQPETVEAPTQGGSIAVQAAQITLPSATLDASGGRGGSIVLDASAPAPEAPPAPLPAPEPGKVALLGNTQASTRGRRGPGGSLTLLGNDIGLKDHTALDASGATGGGTVRVGGGWQGGEGLHQATTVTMGDDVLIDASATQQGDGGSVVLWSDVARADGHTQVGGRVLARGGAAGGDGGRVETSGHTVAIEGVRVNAGADAGQGGLWLIDPYNYVINGAQAAAIVGNAGSGLNSGTSVTVTTTANVVGYGSSGNAGDVGNIDVNAAIHKTSGGDATLTLQAHGGITMYSGVSSSAGKLNLVLIADWDSSGGGAVYLNGSSFNTNGGHVWIGGNGYASGNTTTTWNGLQVGTGLANASNDIPNYEGVRLRAATIATGGGHLFIGGRTVRTTNPPRYGVVIDTGSSISTGAGSITVQGSIQPITDGSSDALEAVGLRLDNASLSSTSGQITLTGSVEGSLQSGAGLNLRNGVSITSTSGGITLRGTASGVSNIPSGGVFGTYLHNRVTVSSDSGAINLYGTATANSSTGAGIWMGSTSGGSGDGNQSTGAGAGEGYNVAIVSNSGDVLVDARGTSAATTSWFHGFTVIAYGGDRHLFKTTSGNITVKGDANVAKNDSSGVQWQVNAATGNIHVLSTSGDIYVQGYQHSGNTDPFNNALRFTPGDSVGSIRFGAATDGGTYTGRITFEADSIWNNTANTSLTGAIKAVGSGAMAFQSSAAQSVKDFSLVNLWDFGSAHSSFAIGKPTENKRITLGASITAAGPITVYGGNIVLNNNLTSTAAGAGIRLMAVSSITNSGAALKSLVTNGGDVLLSADTDGNHLGNIVFDNSSGGLSIDTRAGLPGSKSPAATGGGAVTLGGGNLQGTGLATGYNPAGWQAEGIRIDNGFTVRSGGGDVNLRGRSWGSTITGDTAGDPRGAFGVGFHGSSGAVFIDSGAGRIRIEGQGRTGGTYSLKQGIASYRAFTLQSSHAGADAIQLIGTQTVNSGNNRAAIGLGYGGVATSIVASGVGGGISLLGNSTHNGLALFGATDLLANGGDLQLVGTRLGGATSNELYIATGANVWLGSKAASAVTASSSRLLLEYDTFSFNSVTPNIATRGAVTIQSNLPSFTHANIQSRWFNWNQNGQTIGGLTIGKPSNTGADVTLDGTAGGGTLVVNGPVTVYGKTVTSTAGLNVTGTGDIWLQAFANANPSIQINGSITKTGGGDATLTMKGAGRVNAFGSISASGAGTGKLNMVFWADSDGNRYGGDAFQPASSYNSNGGHIWIGGSATPNGSVTWNGLTVGNGASIGAYGANSHGVDLAGTFTTGGGDFYVAAKTYTTAMDIVATNGSVVVKAGSGNVSFVGNRIDFGGLSATGATTTVTSTGTLTIRPYDDSFGYDFNIQGGQSGSDWLGTTIASLTGSGDYNVRYNAALSNNTLGFGNLVIRNVASLGGLVVGKEANTSAVTVRNNLGILGDISLFGGRIANAGGAGLTSTGGSILLDADLDQTLNFDGAGISWTGALTASSTAAGRGNLTLRGRAGTKQANNNHGVVIGAASALNAGGDIAITGLAPAAGNMGVSIATGASITAGRTLAIDGRNIAAVSSAANVGLRVGDNAQLRAAGALALTGQAGPGSSAALQILNGASIATTGTAGASPITLTARGGSIGSNTGTAGNNTQASITAGAGSDLTLTADTLDFVVSRPIALTTTGVLTLQPFSANFPTTFLWDGSLAGGHLTGAGSLANVQLRNLASLGGLTLGKAGNTSHLVVDAPMAAAGPIRLYGHDIALNAGLTASGNATADRNRIVLTAGGNVTQTAALAARGLSLQGSGRFTLDHAGNDVDVLTAGSASTPVGRLAYLDADDLAIGSVDGATGITSSGTVRVETLTGNLHLGASVATTSTSTDAVVLNAARAKGVADGDFFSGAGGSITVGGGSTVSTGAGGRATLYTGSVAGSTGLAALVGNGSGRFRYASDELTTTYLSPLGTGLYAIHREQPTITLRGIDQSVVYGNEASLAVGASGLQNGDSVAQSMGRLPTATLAGATRSAAGHVNVRRDGGGNVIGHGMVLSRDAVSALGYTLAYDDGGNTTVTPKALAAVINDDAKFVGLADVAGYAGATYSGFVRGESIADVAASATIVRSMAGESIGAYGGALTGSVSVAAGNYVLDPASVTAGNFHIVGPETLIVRVGSATAVYGNAAAYEVAQVRYYDAVNGVERSLTQGADEFHWSFGGNPALGVEFALASAGINVGNHAITGTVITPHGLPGTASSSTPNNLLAIGGRLTITPRTLTLAASKTYDGSTALGAGAITLGNLVGGQTLNYSGALASDRNVATADKYVSAMTLQDGTGLASNYQLPGLTQAAAGSNTVAITPRSLGVAVDKVYDGLASATAAQTLLTNLVAGETLAIGSVTLSDSHVATAGKYVSGLTLGDSGPWQLSNYSLPGLSAVGGRNSVVIRAAQLTVGIASAGGTSKTYDGTTTTSGFTPTFSVDGYVAGDSAASFGYTASYDTDTVDATRITLGGVSLASITSGVGSLTSDYVLDASGASVAGSITPRSVTAAAGAANPVKVYDGTTSVSGANVALVAATGSTGLVAGDDLGITAVGGNYSQSNVGGGLSYTLADITLTGADARNYVLTSGTISGSDGVITPRALTLAAGKTYDGTTALTDVTLGNLVQGEYLLISGTALASSHVAGPDGNVATADNFVRNITLSNVLDGATVVYRTGNYCLPGAGCAAVNSGAVNTLNVHANNQAAVNAALLTVGVAETQVGKVYDGTAQASGGYTYVMNGLAGGDSAATLTQTSAAFNDANVAGAHSFTLSGITVGGVAGSNGSLASDYVLSANSLTLPGSITARAVAVNTAAGVGKTYDGTTGYGNLVIGLTRVAGNAADSGVMAADTGLLDVQASGGGFDNKNAGSGKSYSLTGLALTGSVAGNYTLASGDSISGLDGVIDPKLLWVSGLSTVSKVYDGNTTASYTAGQNGVLQTVAVGAGDGSDGRAYVGDDVVLSGSVSGGAFNSKDVLTATHVDFTGFGLSGADAGNYTVVGRTSASITPKALTATTTLGPKTYDATTGITVTGTTLGGLVGSETLVVAGTGTLDSANAGSRTATVGYALADGGSGGTAGLASNYSLADTTHAVTVAQKLLTMAGSTVDGKVYDGTTSATATAGLLSGFVGSETVGASASGSFDSANAGSRNVTVGYTLADGSNGGLAANYAVANDVLAATIATRAITVTAEAASRVYGDADPAFVYTVGGQGLAGGDTAAGVFSGALGSSATVASGVGNYLVTQGTLAANPNYTLSYLGDMLSITQRAITVAADTASRVYGDANPAFTYTVSGAGLVNGDTLGGALSSTANAASNVGSYAITQGNLAASSNYALSYQGNTLTVTPRGVIVVADALSRAYGDAHPAYTYTVAGAGLASGDTSASVFSGALASDATATSNVGSYAITQGDLALANSNYTLAYTGANLAITPRIVTATGAVVATKVYDGTTDATLLQPGQVATGVGSETLVLSATGADFATAGAGTGKTVTVNGYALANGTNGGIASNYQLASTTATTTADIEKAVLTVVANNDAKFITQADAGGYNGVAYTGFVNGETAAVLGGAPSISRSNAGTDGAGIYTGVLVADTSVLTAANYSFQTVNGSYTIVPSNQLLVRVANANGLYGTATAHTITSAQYFDGVSVVTLASPAANGGNSFTVNDGVGGSATFTVTATAAPVSTGGWTGVGAWQLAGSNITTVNAANFSNTVTVVGSETVDPRGLSVNTSGGISKIYDGSTTMPSVTLQLGGAAAGDVLGVSAQGNFASRNVGSNIAYTVNGVTLLGADAANYYVTGGSSFAGSNGSITPRTLNVGYSGVGKVYDGNTVAAFTSSDDRIAGDVFSVNATGTFADKNVGTGKAVTLSGATLSGGDAGNYVLAVATGSTTADITRLDSVTWIGGADGNWFDPANWAGGAVPDLANVANVVIPNGVTVTFDTAGVVAPAQTGPVQIDSLGGAGGGLVQADGALNVGGGGVTLDSFTQQGGTLHSEGNVVVNDFTQTGGSTSTGGNLTVNENFAQGPNGSVVVQGNASITDTSGGTSIGNLQIGGDAAITSTDGAITQQPGTVIAVEGSTTLDAGTSDIVLDGPNNDFTGPFNASGNNITVVDGNGGLVIGNIDAAGDLDATSTDGDITQQPGSVIVVDGSTTVDAGSGDIVLDGPNNDFQGPFNGTGHDITVVDGNGGLVIGNIDAAGDLDATSTDGDITQQPGSVVVVDGSSTVDAGTGNIVLDGPNNDFQGPFNGTGNDITVVDGNGGLVIGNIDAGGISKPLAPMAPSRSSRVR